MERLDSFKTYPYLVFLFCIFIYSFSFKHYAFIGYMIFYILPLIYLFFNINILIKLFKVLDLRRFICFSLIALLLLLSVVVPVFHNTSDYSFFNTVFYIVRKMIPYLFLVVCLIKKYGENACADIFMYYFAISTVCYVCVTCLFLIFTPIQNFWMSIVTSDSQSDLLESAYGYAARVGWAGFSGFRITMKCSISVSFVMFLRFSKNSKLQISLVSFWILFGFSILGNAFYGRIGLLASILVVLICLVAYQRIQFGSLFRWIIGVAVIIGVFYVLSLLSPQMQQWFTWMSTPFINLIQTGSFDNSSVDALFGRMTFMPDLSTMIFGDGLFTTSGGYYMKTDLGIMRQILFWGLPLTLVSYFLTYQSVATLGRRFRAEIFSLLICIVLFEFKGLSYYEFVALFLPIGFLEKHGYKYSSLKLNSLNL